MVLSSADTFSKSVVFFSKRSFGNISRVSSSLDPDHARHFMHEDCAS